jgi:hypothetical protein
MTRNPGVLHQPGATRTAAPPGRSHSESAISLEIDGAEVHAAAEHLERSGAREGVLQREVDEVAVRTGGEPDGVLVPEQDVEGGRRLAQQV